MVTWPVGGRAVSGMQVAGPQQGAAKRDDTGWCWLCSLCSEESGNHDSQDLPQQLMKSRTSEAESRLRAYLEPAACPPLSQCLWWTETGVQHSLCP